MGDTKPARILVHGQRLTEFVQTDVADREIAEDDGQSFSVFAALEVAISTLIVSERFRRAVLTIKDVADIYVEAGEAPAIFCRGEDLAGPIGSGKCAIVFA